jgi:peroxiredoxin
MKRLMSVLAILAFVIPSTILASDLTSKKAPNFSLKTSDGKTIDLSKLKGKVVVVNFWATWCGPCRAEIPAFMEVYEKYKASGLEMIGISLDQGGWSEVTPFLNKYKISYPVVLGNDKIARQYGGIEAIPTTFVIDKNGVVVVQHIGGLRKEDLENKIKGIL